MCSTVAVPERGLSYGTSRARRKHVTMMRGVIAASRDHLRPSYSVPSPLFSMRVHLAAICAAVLAAAPLQSQILRIPRRSGEPGSFLTVAAGLRQQQAVTDGTTASTWDFGQGFEYRASLENHIRNGTSIGIAFGQSNLPLLFRAGLSETDARAKLQTLMIVLHGGAPRGFHQVFDIGAGITRFSNFRRSSDKTAIAGAPAKDDDPTLALGYGFGYGFSSRSAVTIVQEYGLVLHQSKGLSGNSARSSQAYTTRVGLRMGFGTKKGRR